MGSSGTDTSTWKGLADNGELKFDSSVAQECLTACQTLLGNIETMMNSIGGLKSPAEPLFTKISDTGTDTVDTPTRYRKLLNDKWTELHDTLDQHKQLLNTVGDTFIHAAKAYGNSEHDSALTFDDPNKTGTITIDSTGTITPPAWSTYSSGSSGSSGASGSSGSTTITPDDYATTIADAAEDGTSFGLEQFYYIDKSIIANRNDLTAAAEQWQSVQRTWDGWAMDFHTHMKAALTSGNWTGKAAPAASTAIDNYVNGAVTQLGKSMSAMYKTIVTLDSLLTDIANTITKELDTAATKAENATFNRKDGCCADSYAITDLQDYWSKTYPPGLHKIATLTPAFKDPATITKNGSGGSGSGGGSGGSGGSGSGGGSGGSGSGGGSGGGSGSGGGDSGGGGKSGGGGGDDSGSGGGDSGGGDKSGGGGGDESGGGSGGSGAGGGKGHGGSGSGGSGGSGASGGSGSFGAGTGASGSAGDLLSLFGEVLQLLSSGIPGLMQLGSQLLQQLPPGLQQLGQAFQSGMLTFGQAMNAAATEVGKDVQDLQKGFDRDLRRVERDLGILPADDPGSPVEPHILAGPLGPTGPLSPGVEFSRASAPFEAQPTAPTDVVAGVAAAPSPSATPGTPVQPGKLEKLEVND
ncbi:hypothetical protein [Nocardia sp. NPDC051570]|uniref:hypothetical protein n=1 Tax=Nocardia sp. NPDC051570 TaxID=3364324 RepID=UPI0037A98F90